MTDFNFRKLPLAGAPPRDVSEVVNISDFLGIGDKVARTYPVVNIKG